MRDAGSGKINHLDSDGDWALTGSDHDLRLWSLAEGEEGEGCVRTVRAGYVCCCVLYYPLAAATGLSMDRGVNIWDMNKVGGNHFT